MSNMDLSTINPEDELDLDGFGLQEFTDTFLIVEAGFQDSDQGRRWYILAEPTTNEEAKEELPNGQVRDGGYLTHVDREELVRMGVGGLKRYFRACLGKQNGSILELKGATFQARCSEDDAGFARLRGIRPAS